MNKQKNSRIKYATAATGLALAVFAISPVRDLAREISEQAKASQVEAQEEQKELANIIHGRVSTADLLRFSQTGDSEVSEAAIIVLETERSGAMLNDLRGILKGSFDGDYSSVQYEIAERITEDQYSSPEEIDYVVRWILSGDSTLKSDKTIELLDDLVNTNAINQQTLEYIANNLDRLEKRLDKSDGHKGFASRNFVAAFKSMEKHGLNVTKDSIRSDLFIIGMDSKSKDN